MAFAFFHHYSTGFHLPHFVHHASPCAPSVQLLRPNTNTVLLLISNLICTIGMHQHIFRLEHKCPLCLISTQLDIGVHTLHSCWMIFRGSFIIVTNKGIRCPPGQGNPGGSSSQMKSYRGKKKRVFFKKSFQFVKAILIVYNWQMKHSP